jgi:hypothetical protein
MKLLRSEECSPLYLSINRRIYVTIYSSDNRRMYLAPVNVKFSYRCDLTPSSRCTPRLNFLGFHCRYRTVNRAATTTTTLAADLSFVLLRQVPPPHVSDLRSRRTRRCRLRPPAALPDAGPRPWGGRHPVDSVAPASAHRRETLLSRCPGLDVGPLATDVGRQASAPSRPSLGALSFVKGFFKFNMNLLWIWTNLEWIWDSID